MSTTKLVVSDLHLGDGSSILDCFGPRQQTAFAELLQAASSSAHPLGQADEVEFIINGDCFDFLVTTPYEFDGLSDQDTALDKLERILAAHEPFIAALSSFLQVPGRSLTFVIGNHDIELCFAQVRTRICKALTGNTTDNRVYFCLSQAYRPLPDISIEHGNHYDFWNHAVQNLWDEQGEPLFTAPETIVLPVGSRYYQHASYPLSLRYAYFDHFEPSISITRQMALLCLLDPSLVQETTKLTMQLLSYPRSAYAGLSPDELQQPTRLFEATILDLIAFQEDMVANKPDWHVPEEEMQVSEFALLEFMRLREALAQPLPEALAAVFAPSMYEMSESVANGMQAVLRRDPQLRYVLAGHTHMWRADAGPRPEQVYYNTGSWTDRWAPPTPEHLDDDLIAWLRTPDWQHVPLRDVTRFLFALVTASEGSGSDVQLCIWEGGSEGRYRNMTAQEE